MRRKDGIMVLEVFMLEGEDERSIKMQFLSLKQLYEFKLYPKITDYKITYRVEREDGMFQISSMLEDLYERLNRSDRPNRRNMRSMSVGDIVRINGKELYFCDSIGFKEMRLGAKGEILPKERLLFLQRTDGDFKKEIYHSGTIHRYQIIVASDFVEEAGMVFVDQSDDGKHLEWINLVDDYRHQGFLWEVMEEVFRKTRSSSFTFESTREQMPLWIHLGAEPAGVYDGIKKVQPMVLTAGRFLKNRNDRMKNLKEGK